MSVITIPNQTVAFNYPLNDCDSCDDRDFYTPILEGDTVDFQFKQTPCGPNLLCDKDFNQLGDNLITNGTFTGSAASWTLGLGWTYGVNNVHFDDTVGHGNLTQTIATALIPNKYYVLRVLTSNLTGTLNIVVTLGGVISTTVINPTGDTFIILRAGNVNNDLVLNQNIYPSVFDLDNVELYEITPCWEGGIYWVGSPYGKYVHIAGSTTALAQVTPPLTVGYYYYIAITLENVTAGSVRVFCGSNYSTEISIDGTSVRYVVCAGTGDFSIVPTSDFEGYVVNVVVQKLKNDYTFGVLDLVNSIEYTTGAIASYFNEYVTVRLNPMTYIPAGHNCFKIIIHDTCTEYYQDIVTNGAFSTAFTGWLTVNNWFQGFFDAWCYPAYNSTLIQPSIPYTAFKFGIDIFPGITKYYYHIKVTGDVDANSYVQIAVGGHIMVTITAPGVYEGVVTTGAAANNLIFVFAKGYGVYDATKSIHIDDIQVIPVFDVDRTYTSQQFTIFDTTICTRKLVAWCDNNISGGFNFTDTLFKITQRMIGVQVNPIYPEQRNDYLFSNGTRKVIYAQSEKYWKLRTDFIPEWAHDCLRFQVMCDHLFMDDVEYYDKGGDYVPDYLSGNDYVRLASVTREWKIKSDAVFKSFINNL